MLVNQHYLIVLLGYASLASGTIVFTYLKLKYSLSGKLFQFSL